MGKLYPLAPDGVFWTLQGEGHLRGFQMAFVRLAGCSVGCAECDTDYSVAEKLDTGDIVRRLETAIPANARDPWVWITGGEPADHDLRPLLSAIKARGWSTAVATSGSKRVIAPVDWLSVSPHSLDRAKFVQRYGNEIKIADGLNGLDPDAWLEAWPDSTSDFMYRYVQPLGVGGVESPSSLARCLDFLKRNPTWALSRQDHKVWGVS